jgi:alpha-tubulin suppressor-like RCC1 family protein
LPKNPYTKGIFEQNELHCYGFISNENTKTFLLDKYIDKNDFVKKISAGENQILILFGSGKLGVLGDNANGQLGLPLKRGENENIINEIFVYKPNLIDNNYVNLNVNSYQIIDIACGEHFSLLLVSINNKNYLYKLGYSQEDRYKDDIENISPIVSFIHLNCCIFI